ncbi:hypothetical protein F0919_14085 [Taibaiella lutea]|uniref:Uncharacterized protein n=1 Tax=Taibaiella lutea TaxID=2608001 RepID=A0A5M6CI83_9BACT|nr:hypothetical protein [Taibaiella lutea]KAA5533662.1 hypothetical protein F0919_14085 [Taibaiella lutea]
MGNIKNFTVLALALMLSFATLAQTDSIKLSLYNKAYNNIYTMLTKGRPSFKAAVFAVENAYYRNSLSYEAYEKTIKGLAALAKAYLRSNPLLYQGKDSATIGKYAAVFKIMTDSIPISFNDTILYHIPYKYNFSDFDGSADWSDMFVSKLLETHQGNCHSMPYLYKIIVQELGEEAYLALAPNHIYLKLFSEKDGWYNTELTSGDFPIDAWIMASGYVHLSAIQNAVYMDTIGNTKSVAMCLVDLAQGLDMQAKGNAIDTFVLKCCNTALTYFPNYINALLLQSKIYERQFSERLKADGYSTPQEYLDKDPESKRLFGNMTLLTSKIYDLGYRRMPVKMYMEWLSVLKTQHEKYSNKKINFTK